MIIQDCERGIEIDIESSLLSGVIQRYENGEWRKYQVNGKPVHWPAQLEKLPPGENRVVPEKNPQGALLMSKAHPELEYF